MEPSEQSPTTLKDRVRIIIFEAGTPAGKAFDVALIVFILASVVLVMVDTVPAVHARYGEWLYIAEWAFATLFAIEYALRLWSIQNTWAYARSFYGLVDLMDFVNIRIHRLIQ